MSKRCAFKWMFLVTLLASLIGLVACAPTPEGAAVAEAQPRAWIDFPRDGATIPVGASVVVVSHAYAADGITEVLLSVNGVAYRRDPPAAIRDTLVEVRQNWMPTEPGLHTLEVRAYDAAGRLSGAGAITVRVTGEAPPATAVPTEMPTVAPTAVPAEPTWTPTPIPPTPVPTSVPTPVPTPVPPTSPPTPIPEATIGAPADTTPPPAPQPYVPADELVLTCRSRQTLVWLPVTDPSGVVYYVKLEWQVTADQWVSVGGWGPLGGKQVEVDVQCGGIYRWAVRAQDGAGNFSDWSEWFTFSVSIG